MNFPLHDVIEEICHLDFFEKIRNQWDIISNDEPVFVFEKSKLLARCPQPKLGLQLGAVEWYSSAETLRNK